MSLCENVVASESCGECSRTFDIWERDAAFYNRLDVPFPRLCPECRQQRRLAFNNELNFHKRLCDFSGEKIISIYPQTSSYKVYKQEIWWSDAWDPTEYGRDFNFSEGFFEQFDRLCREVPQAALQTNYLLDENAPYTNYAGSNKDCYLIVHADFNRDCYYGYGVKNDLNVVDVYNVFDSELCYECIDCRNCYNLRYSQNCVDCSDSFFLRDCLA